MHVLSLACHLELQLLTLITFCLNFFSEWIPLSTCHPHQPRLRTPFLPSPVRQSVGVPPEMPTVLLPRQILTPPPPVPAHVALCHLRRWWRRRRRGKIVWRTLRSCSFNGLRICLGFLVILSYKGTQCEKSLCIYSRGVQRISHEGEDRRCPPLCTSISTLWFKKLVTLFFTAHKKVSFKKCYTWYMSFHSKNLSLFIYGTLL